MKLEQHLHLNQNPELRNLLERRYTDGELTKTLAVDMLLGAPNTTKAGEIHGGSAQNIKAITMELLQTDMSKCILETYLLYHEKSDKTGDVRDDSLYNRLVNALRGQKSHRGYVTYAIFKHLKRHADSSTNDQIRLIGIGELVILREYFQNQILDRKYGVKDTKAQEENMRLINELDNFIYFYVDQLEKIDPETISSIKKIIWEMMNIDVQIGQTCDKLLNGFSYLDSKHGLIEEHLDEERSKKRKETKKSKIRDLCDLLTRSGLLKLIQEGKLPFATDHYESIPGEIAVNTIHELGQYFGMETAIKEANSRGLLGNFRKYMISSRFYERLVDIAVAIAGEEEISEKELEELKKFIVISLTGNQTTNDIQDFLLKEDNYKEKAKSAIGDRVSDLKNSITMTDPSNLGLIIAEEILGIRESHYTVFLKEKWPQLADGLTKSNAAHFIYLRYSLLEQGETAILWDKDYIQNNNQQVVDYHELCEEFIILLHNFGVFLIIRNDKIEQFHEAKKNILPDYPAHGDKNKYKRLKKLKQLGYVATSRQEAKIFKTLQSATPNIAKENAKSFDQNPTILELREALSLNNQHIIRTILLSIIMIDNEYEMSMAKQYKAKYNEGEYFWFQPQRGLSASIDLPAFRSIYNNIKEKTSNDTDSSIVKNERFSGPPTKHLDIEDLFNRKSIGTNLRSERSVFAEEISNPITSIVSLLESFKTENTQKEIKKEQEIFLAIQSYLEHAFIGSQHFISNIALEDVKDLRLFQLIRSIASINYCLGVLSKRGMHLQSLDKEYIALQIQKINTVKKQFTQNSEAVIQKSIEITSHLEPHFSKLIYGSDTNSRIGEVIEFESHCIRQIKKVKQTKGLRFIGSSKFYLEKLFEHILSYLKNKEDQINSASNDQEKSNDHVSNIELYTFRKNYIGKLLEQYKKKSKQSIIDNILKTTKKEQGENYEERLIYKILASKNKHYKDMLKKTYTVQLKNKKLHIEVDVKDIEGKIEKYERIVANSIPKLIDSSPIRIEQISKIHIIQKGDCSWLNAYQILREFGRYKVGNIKIARIENSNMLPVSSVSVRSFDEIEIVNCKFEGDILNYESLFGLIVEVKKIVLRNCNLKKIIISEVDKNLEELHFENCELGQLIGRSRLIGLKKIVRDGKVARSK